MYGEKISKETQKLIRKYLTTKDYKIIAEKSGCSYSTLCNIIDRRQNLTKNNIAGYKAALKASKRVAKKAKSQSSEDIKKLSLDD